MPTTPELLFFIIAFCSTTLVREYLERTRPLTKL